MKIECPSCHLTGNVNELELPPLGRTLACPRCKISFHVAKPAASASQPGLRNSCPSCQYATFTEEMFADCPKCGMTAEEYQLFTRKQRDREQSARDHESLNRSFRNPDLIKAPVEESAAEPVRVVQAIEVTAWSCLAVAGVLLIYGILGLVKYYSKDWQAVLSEPVLEPVTKFFVFFHLGLIPWLVTLFSLYFSAMAYQFLRVRGESLKRLAESAWAGIGVVIVYEIVAFCDWARLSSGKQSLSYYAVGMLSALMMSALLGAPFFALLWHLNRDQIVREFNKARVLSGRV
jgi:uncharacterized C2H2 Zn-finger protein